MQTFFHSRSATAGSRANSVKSESIVAPACCLGCWTKKKSGRGAQINCSINSALCVATTQLTYSRHQVHWPTHPLRRPSRPKAVSLERVFRIDATAAVRGGLQPVGGPLPESRTTQTPWRERRGIHDL